MQMSSTLCYAQEADQLKRAMEITFETVRVTATRAATAWNFEARAAEGREERKLRTRAFNEVARAAAIASLEISRSENPDRGFADA